MPLAPAPAAPAEQEVVLTWTVHLLRRDPGKAKGLALCLAGTAFGGLLLFHNLALALLPAAVLALSLSDFLFPVHYTLTPQGAAARSAVSHLEMAWADVRHAYLADDGVKLSPLRRRGSRWEPLRGVFVRFDGDNQGAVVEAVRRLREEAERRAPTAG